MKKSKLFGLNIGSIIKVTPGGHHAWYETNLGYPIRKELGGIKKSFNDFKFGEYSLPSVDVNALTSEKKSYIWKRFKKWVKELFHFGRKGGN